MIATQSTVLTLQSVRGFAGSNLTKNLAVAKPLKTDFICYTNQWMRLGNFYRQFERTLHLETDGNYNHGEGKNKSNV